MKSAAVGVIGMMSSLSSSLMPSAIG